MAACRCPIHASREVHGRAVARPFTAVRSGPHTEQCCTEYKKALTHQSDAESREDAAEQSKER